MILVKSAVLTREERDTLILAAVRQNDKQLSNREIAQHLGIPVARVKMIIHRACIKMKAGNRNEALVNAIVKFGEISIKEVLLLDEILTILGSVSSVTLRSMAYLLRRKDEYGYIPDDNIQIASTDRKRNGILTKREREILILIGRGLSNKDIADKLFMSCNSVATILHRACTKLGTRRRSDATVLAVKQGEISTDEIFSLHELVQIFNPLGVEVIEKMAQLLDHSPGQQAIPAGQ